ncbi:hypothetical protein ACET60_09220 [Aeromonas veronii]
MPQSDEQAACHATASDAKGMLQANDSHHQQRGIPTLPLTREE